MNDGDSRVSGEIPVIQREYIEHAMNKHGGHQPGVVHLGAGHSVLNNKPAPFQVDRFIVRQKPESGFNDLGSIVCFSARQAEAIPGEGAGAHVPEFNQILSGVARLLSARG